MHSRGYTLIEILVALGIFTIVMAAPTGFFVMALKGQQRALATQEILDEVSYSLEYVSRALRMAKKELNCTSKTDPLTCSCLKNNGYGFNYESTYGGKGIKFNTYKTPSDCQEIFWDTSDNRLKEIRNGGQSVALTSDELEIVAFKIGSSDSWTQNDNKQPRITLFLEVKGKKSSNSELQPVLKIQTSISQRNLDVTY